MCAKKALSIFSLKLNSKCFFGRDFQGPKIAKKVSFLLPDKKWERFFMDGSQDQKSKCQERSHFQSLRTLKRCTGKAKSSRDSLSY